MNLEVASRSSPVGYGGAPFAVLLAFRGGPTREADVRAYLEQRLLDNEPFSVGFILRAPLTRWNLWWQARRLRQRLRQLPAPLRFPQVAARVAAGVEKRLRLRGRDASVRNGSRFLSPGIEPALVELHSEGLRRLVLILLHPQASASNTGCVHREWRRAVARSGCLFRVSTVESWYADVRYLDLMAHQLRHAIEDVAEEERRDLAVLFCAEANLDSGRPEDAAYREQVEATIQGIVARLPHGLRWRVGYHTGPGPQRWMGPDVASAAQVLAEDGGRHLLSVPLGILEPLETVVELDVQLPRLATSAGFETVRRLPALEDHPVFLDFLAHQVEKRLTAD